MAPPTTDPARLPSLAGPAEEPDAAALGRAAARARVRRAACGYSRARDLPRDLGIRDRPDLPEPLRSRALVRALGQRLHAFLREGWRYEPACVRPLLVERLRVALAGELRAVAAEQRREAAE